MNTAFFFGVTNPDDDISKKVIAANQNEFAFWHSLMPDDDADLATSISHINIRTAIPKKFIAATLFTMRFLPQLPLLSALTRNLGHLDLTRLNTITRFARKIPSELISLFDEHITDYLTPSRGTQVLPQSSSIAAMLRKFKAHYCPENTASENIPAPNVRFSRHRSGLISVGATISEQHATLLRSALERVTRNEKCNEIEALIHIIQGIRPRVIMNVYGTESQPEYLADGTWLSPKEIEFWKSQIGQVRDMDSVECAITPTYSPTAEMRAFVKGRDITCKAPDCAVNARLCEIDHIIPFGAGGPTTPWNLQCLCKFHHCQKTDGRLKAFPLPNGDVLFVIDGVPAISTPEGPLSKSHKTWGTKFGAYMDRKTAA